MTQRPGQKHDEKEAFEASAPMFIGQLNIRTQGQLSGGVWVYNDPRMQSCWLAWQARASPNRQLGPHGDVAAAIERIFGYVPNENIGESWAIYRGQTLIVIHSDRRPRLYKAGGGGVHVELDPSLP